jgi:tetratricopeptide (TPR) repeat protein
MHPDFDPLVGKYPPLREIVEPYIKFGRKNPSLVKAEALSRVQQQLDTLQALSRSHAAMERNFDWRVKEQGLLGTLRADPAKGLAMLKEEIAERKKADSKDPSLADSITLIGYQLVQVGLYSDAEEFIREAIALREKQGAPASHALGHCLSNLGVLYLEEGKLEQSKPLLEKALKMREGDPADEFAKAKTQIAYGRLLAAQGNLKEAEEQLKAAVGRLQQNSAVPEKLSAREFNLTRTPIPVIMELRAMKMQEHYVASFFYPLALIELGSLYRQEGKHDIARATINQAKACPSAESRGSGRQVSMIS